MRKELIQGLVKPRCKGYRARRRKEDGDRLFTFDLAFSKHVTHNVNVRKSVTRGGMSKNGVKNVTYFMYGLINLHARSALCDQSFSTRSEYITQLFTQKFTEHTTLKNNANVRY